MKGYHQRCSLACALDVVGERWAMLVIRELILGPRRFRDLQVGLPGIPTNVLSSRLKELLAAGVIDRRALPPPTAVTVYELTEAGRALRPILSGLREWGRRYGPAPAESDTVQPGWALLGASGRPTALPGNRSCELRVGDELFHLTADADGLVVHSGPSPAADAVLTMTAEELYGLLGGRTPTATIEGDPRIAAYAVRALRGSGVRG